VPTRFLLRFDEKTGALTPNDPAFVTSRPGPVRAREIPPNGRWFT